MTDKYLKIFEVPVRVVLNPAQLDETVSLLTYLKTSGDVNYYTALFAAHRSVDGFVRVGVLLDGKLEILP